MIACEICESASAPFVFVRGHQYYRCSSCGLTFLSGAPREEVVSLYDDAYFSGGGSGYSDYLSEAAILRASGRRYARVLGRYSKPGFLLDAGAAAGFIAQGFCERGWRVLGIEPNARMRSSAPEAAGYGVCAGTLETFRSPRRFEAVVMIQVIAHFCDLGAALRSAAGATARDGLWLVETWNAESITAKILGKQWHEFSPPSVRRIFTPRALDRAAAKFGFQHIARGRPRKYVLGSHAKSLLEHKAADGIIMRAAALAARMLPENLRIPYPSEDVFWALYRK